MARWTGKRLLSTYMVPRHMLVVAFDSFNSAHTLRLETRQAIQRALSERAECAERNEEEQEEEEEDGEDEEEEDEEEEYEDTEYEENAGSEGGYADSDHSYWIDSDDFPASDDSDSRGNAAPAGGAGMDRHSRHGQHST